MHRLAAHRDGERRARRRSRAAIEVGRPIAFATLIVIAVFLPLFGMTRHRGPHVPAARGGGDRDGGAPRSCSRSRSCRSLAALVLRPRAPDAPEDVVAHPRASSASTRRCSTPACGTPAACASRRSRHRSRARARRSRIGTRLHAASSTRARSCCRRSLPPEASLDEVDRLNHRVEDVLRDVPRGRGRRAAHRPRRAHRGSDAAHGLRRARRAASRTARARSTSSRRRCARRVEKVPGVSVLFTTPLGMRIDEGLGGTPADLSVRIFGPDLDELARARRRSARRSWRASTGIADLRAEQLTGLPQLRIARRSRGGRARRAHARAT